MDKNNSDRNMSNEEIEQIENHEDNEDQYPIHSYEETSLLEDYSNLVVNENIKKIFNYILLYTPKTIDIDLKLKPFIPDYIPAIGDIDSFVKIPRPDDQVDNLGITILDEPSIKNQSDSSLLKLKLKAFSKNIILNDENEMELIEKNHIVKLAENNRDIDLWINSIKNLHETENSNSSNLINMIAKNTKMPDLEKLMQQLPNKVEKLINNNEILLPDQDMECSLDEYINIICAVLDIPVNNSKIASLYILFNLYNELCNLQHFKLELK